MKNHTSEIPELELMYESKIRRLLGDPPEKRFEASGVCVQDDACYVIFDNTSYLARFEMQGSQLSSDNRIIPLHSPFSGYEDIAFDPQTRRYDIREALTAGTTGIGLAQLVELFPGGAVAHPHIVNALHLVVMSMCVAYLHRVCAGIGVDDAAASCHSDQSASLTSGSLRI